MRGGYAGVGRFSSALEGRTMTRMVIICVCAGCDSKKIEEEDGILGP
jgi:hypothetical protein